MASLGANLYRDRFSQKTDIPIEFAHLGGNGASELELLIRYMYYRSSESRSAADPEMAIGQDYLRWYYTSDHDSFDFVVCDGVGQSFLGYIAAEFLGEKLLDWLEAEGLSLVKKFKKNKQGGFEETIAGQIRSWHDEAMKEVHTKQLPPSLPAIVRTALEDSRDTHGSETVFVGGHLSLEERAPYLILFWMGDVRFRLFDRNGSDIETKAIWNNAERWSTKHGLKGKSMPNCWAGNLNEHNVARIMAYSDGLSTIEAELPSLTSADLQDRANRLLVSPSSDDISFIDVLLQPFDLHFQDKFQDLPPKLERNDQLKLTQSAEYALSWEKIDGAEQYFILEEADNLPQREVFRSTEPSVFVLKEKLPGLYRYKLRAVYPGAKEEEGPEIQIRVTYTQPNKGKATASVNSASMPTPGIRTSPLSPIDAYKSSQTEEAPLEKPKWAKDPIVDFERKTVTLTWEPVRESDEYSIEISTGGLRPEFIWHVYGKSYDWHPKNWEGSYKIRIRAHQGNQLPVESDPQLVVLNVPKPPRPVIQVLNASSIIAGQSFRLSCKSSGKAYSKNCKYSWQRSQSQGMEMSHRFQNNISELDETIDKSGTYYYQVQVWQDDVLSDWSLIQRIDVEHPLDKPVIIEPKSGSIVDTIFFLKCPQVRGAKKYTILYQVYGDKDWETYNERGYSLKLKDGQCEFRLTDNYEGKYSFRLQAFGKSGNKTLSEPVTVEISDQNSKQVLTIPSNTASFSAPGGADTSPNSHHRTPLATPRVVKIVNVEWLPYGACEIRWDEDYSRYMVLQFKANNLTTAFAHKLVVKNDKCIFPITTLGKYYFYVVEDVKRDGSYDPPESTQDFFAFKTPLKRPTWIHNTSFQAGATAHQGILKFEWMNVAGADCYQLVVDDVSTIITTLPQYNTIYQLIDFTIMGWHKIEIQALNQKSGLESSFKTLQIYVEKRHNRLEITDYREN